MKSIQFFSFLIVIIVCLLFFSSCQKEKVLLTDTEWKFVSFVSVASGEVKEPVPKDAWCYLIIFHKHKKILGNNSLTKFRGNLSGNTSTNKFQGNYKINYSTHYINIDMEMSTLLGEFPDGDLYTKSLENVDFFSVQENELKLYYNNKQNYLLYKSF